MVWISTASILKDHILKLRAVTSQISHAQEPKEDKQLKWVTQAKPLHLNRTVNMHEGWKQVKGTVGPGEH